MMIPTHPMMRPYCITHHYRRYDDPHPSYDEAVLLDLLHDVRVTSLGEGVAIVRVVHTIEHIAIAAGYAARPGHLPTQSHAIERQ